VLAHGDVVARPDQRLAGRADIAVIEGVESEAIAVEATAAMGADVRSNARQDAPLHTRRVSGRTRLAGVSDDLLGRPARIQVMVVEDRR